MAIIHLHVPGAFVTLVPRGEILLSPEEFKTWLKEFDSDKDGRISREELRESMRAMGGWFTRWKARNGLKFADKNGNGFVDDNEINNLKDFALKHLGIRIVTD